MLKIDSIMLIVFSLFCIIGLFRAEKRKEQKIKPMAALQALREGVSRSVEMGRPVLFHFGTLTLGDRSYQIAPALSMLGHVARVSAEVGAHLTATTLDPQTQAIMEEVIKDNYAAVGQSDENLDVRYVASSGYPYTVALMGILAREKPGAHFLMGSGFFEVIIICESAARVGAFQVSGSPTTYQLPMMIATCDYVLLGEEYTVAGAFLSQDLGQLGTVVGQDWCKAVLIVLVFLGGILATLGIPWIRNLF